MKLIVGVDPGIITGLAISDISSDFCRCTSMKDITLAKMHEFIMQYGEPIVVATDVKKVPGKVRKVSSTFNARLFLPKEDISVEEKMEMTKGLTENSHERDALAAALFAKKHYEGLVKKVKNALKEKNLEGMSNEVLELLIKREVGNIEQAVKLLTKESKPENKERIPVLIETKQIMTLRKKIAELEREKGILLLRIKEMKDEYNKPLNTVVKNRYAEMTINSLREENEELKKRFKTYKRLIAEGYEIVVPEQDLEEKNQIVLASGNNIKRLEKLKPKAIIVPEITEATDIPVFLKENLRIEEIDGFIAVKKSELEKTDPESFIKWLAHYKER